MLYLAQNHKKPAGNVDSKPGLWSPQRHFYGFYDSRLWGNARHFKKSATKDHHSRSTSASREVGRKRVLSRRAFCACPSCAAPKCDFANCLVIKSLNHKAAPIEFPSADSVEVQRETRSLATFGKELKAGDFYAVKVDLDERRLEGDYWVVRLTEAMKQAEDEYLHAGEVIRKGWLVVKGQWLQYTEPCYGGSTKVGRSYKLLHVDLSVS